MSLVEQTPAPASARRPGLSAPARWAALIGAVALAGFVAIQGKALRDEWRAMRRDFARSRLGVVVGYQDINPKPNYAKKPPDWMHDEEGGGALLWAGWQGNQHTWFRVGRGDLDKSSLRHAFGSDVIRPIDRPIVEQGGGKRWETIPDEAQVAGLSRGEVHAAYPIHLLAKVEVVNERFADGPLLVHYNSFLPSHEATSVYDATLEGVRVTMGLSGYFIGRDPLLFDRETRSLWTARDGALACVAGARKGASLRKVENLTPVSWSSWRSGHPSGRVVVGADRSEDAARPAPADVRQPSTRLEVKPGAPASPGLRPLDDRAASR